jgi:uncharacterized cupin superfamily protein
MPKLDLAAIPIDSACSYPPPHDQPCIGCATQRLGRYAGLSTVGVNLTRLPPGVWSGQRHWHSHEDELVYLIEGELALVTDDGEVTMRAGDFAAFKAGVADGHVLINRTDQDALVLEIGTHDPDRDQCVYSDIDVLAAPGPGPFLHRDGTPYPERQTSTWLTGQTT